MSDREMSRKALYNLLRMNWLEDPTLKVEDWQVEDYRKLELPTLLALLLENGIELDTDKFLIFAESFDCPEDLSDSFVEDSFSVEKQDRIFLVIFELWRRFLQDKPTLSIFADELDHQIYIYDRTNECSEDLKNILEYMVELIEEGVSEEDVFSSLAALCANDIEAFLYDFLADQLDNENYFYVSSFIDRIYDAVPYELPFDFLKIRLLSVSDIESANESLVEIIEVLNEEPDFDLSLEVLQYLADQGATESFINLSLILCKDVNSEVDFLALATAGSEFFASIRKDEMKAQADSLIEKSKEEPAAYAVPLAAYEALISTLAS